MVVSLHNDHVSQNLQQRADPSRGAPPPGARGRPAPPRRPPVSPATYWRRRLVVLGLGAALLTGLSWAVNGLLTASSTAGPVTAAGGAPAASRARHGPARAHSTAKRAAPAASPAPHHTAAPARHRAARQAPVPANAPACGLGGVTLSVSSPQYWYQPGKTPRFTVHAASDGQPCRFNMGAKFVSVVVSTGGRRVWSSADCVSGAGSHVVVLGRGTPAALHVSWDRRTSAPGCDGAGTLVRPGEYHVIAAAGAQHSRSVNIVLGAKGVSGP